MAKIQEMSADISLFLYLIDCLYQLLYIKVRIDILSDRLACVSKDPGDLGGIYLSFVEHCGTGVPCFVDVTLAGSQRLH